VGIDSLKTESGMDCMERVLADGAYIVNGDCSAEMASFPNESFDCIVTSPPYNKGFFTRQKTTNQVWKGFSIDYSEYSDNMPIEEYEEWQINVINTCLSKLKKDGSFFYNHKPIRYRNNVYFPLNFILRSRATIYQEIIWNRKNSPNIRKDCLLPCTERIYWLTNGGKPYVNRDAIGREYISEIWNIPPRPCKEHPAPFPVELARNCILLSTKEGGVVCDPFMGIGTTGTACLETGRRFVGIELDKKYFNIASERLMLGTPLKSSTPAV